MPKAIPADSVGLVSSQSCHFDAPLQLDCGRTLASYDLTYETYGHLNRSRSNAVLVCHALSGDHHAAGYNSLADDKPGWWETCIGPGRPLDTNRFFVVSANNLGGCRGSTGPNTVNPETQKVYGPEFPIVTVRDWVRSQKRLAEALGLEQWAAVAGGSLGGMQALQWAIDFPEWVRHAIVIAAASRLSAQNIAFNEVARQAILSDPNFYQGHYESYGTVPRHGLMLARMLGHITYLSDDSMRAKFGRELKAGKLNFGFDSEFEVESYLRYQGTSFVDRFDANTYLLMTKTLDYFDPAADYDNNLVKAVAQITGRCLVLAFTSDWRFAPSRSREIVKAMVEAGVEVSYAEVEAHHGHDAFLMPIPYYLEVFNAYMQTIDVDG